MIKRQDKEHILQKHCFSWFSWKFPKLHGLLFAVPNGGHRHPATAKKLKAEGVVAGIPDMLFLYQGKLHAFELKNAKTEKEAIRKLQESQKTIHALWSNHNTETILIWSLKQFQEHILNIVKE